MANENHDRTLAIFSRVAPWLLIAVAAGLACVCVWAETRRNWYLAQGTYLGFVFLLALAGVIWWREYHTEREVRPELETLYQALKYLLLAFVVGIVAVLVVTAGTSRWEHGIVAKSAGTGILFAGGTFAIGVLFGFLFGFPPTPSSSTPQPAAQASGAAPQGQTIQASTGTAASPSPSVFENTNLREISDWLTKIIVGAGLVELTKLPPLVTRLAWCMAWYTDPPQPGQNLSSYYPPLAVALAILGYFSACGVLFGFVWTRFEYLSTLYPPKTQASSAVSPPPAGTVLSITTSSLPAGKVGEKYAQTLAASGGTPPYKWESIGGQLPAGLNLDASGMISGTPTAEGTVAFIVQVTDAAANAKSQVFSIAISQ